MKYESDKYHRRSIRLQGYDYSQKGAYFITICTQNRGLLLDDTGTRAIVQKWWDVLLDDTGTRAIVQKWWDVLPGKFPGIRIDQFVIMPNHIHGIIFIEPVGADRRVCPHMGQSHGIAPTNNAITPVGADRRVCHHTGQSRGIAPTLGTIVQWFKTMTTNDYIKAVRIKTARPFPGRLWQRNYYEHIIRDETDLNDIRQYIIDNPAKWEEDKDNPQNIAGTIKCQSSAIRK